MVTAAAHTEFLGDIKVVFNETGHLLSWSGNPHYVGHDVEQGRKFCKKINSKIYFLK